MEKWSGWINAVDPKTGKMAWRVKTPTPMYAALTPTAGNVLFTGDLNGNFLALDARNGKTLYSFNTGGPIAGGVITYEQKGKFAYRVGDDFGNRTMRFRSLEAQRLVHFRVQIDGCAGRRRLQVFRI